MLIFFRCTYAAIGRVGANAGLADRYGQRNGYKTPHG